MPNIFSRSKDQDEEPYVRPSLSLELTWTDSIESTATGSNNPGAGRTIGNLFDAVGGQIERFVNEKAGQYKLGPQAIVEDIRKLRCIRSERELSLRRTTGFIVRLSPTKQEDIKLEKRCRKLLKYCR